MGRPVRLEYDGSLYHVTSRGDRREDIYEDDFNRRRFLELFADVCIHLSKGIGQFSGVHINDKLDHQVFKT